MNYFIYLKLIMTCFIKKTSPTNKVFKLCFRNPEIREKRRKIKKN